MATAKTKGKPKGPPKRVPVGGYVVNFKGCTDARKSLFGSVPMPPSGMTKRLWEDVKLHRLATKGSRGTHVTVASRPTTTGC
ncbi:MAG: hypothetical protein AAB328_11200 [candidate division NC10 bacterium]